VIARPPATAASEAPAPLAEKRTPASPRSSTALDEQNASADANLARPVVQPPPPPDVAAAAREPEAPPPPAAITAAPPDAPPPPAIAAAPREADAPPPPPAPAVAAATAAPPSPAPDAGAPASPPRARDRVVGWFKGEVQEFRDGVNREVGNFRTGYERVRGVLSKLGFDR
jgi:hypothetical protein